MAGSFDLVLCCTKPQSLTQAFPDAFRGLVASSSNLVNTVCASDTEEAWGCASSQVTKSLGLLDVSSNEGI